MKAAPFPERAHLSTTLVRDLVASLRHGDCIDRTVWDTTQAGFGLRLVRRKVGGSLALTWIARRRLPGVSAVRVVLGHASTLRAEDARKRAREALSAMDQGRDPREEANARRAAREARRVARLRTWAVVMRDYADKAPKSLRPETRRARNLVAAWIERASEAPAGHVYAGLAALARTPVIEVTDALVSAALDPILAIAPLTAPAGGPGSGDRSRGPMRSRASLLKLFRAARAAWAAEPSMSGRPNPFDTWRKAHHKQFEPPPPRETALNLRAGEDSPAARWLRALLEARQDPASATAADWVLMCLLWGSRAAETAALRWRDIVLNAAIPHAVFRADTTKTRRAVSRPIRSWACEILARRLEHARAQQLDGPDMPVFLSPAIVSAKQGMPISTAPRRLLAYLEQMAGERYTLHDLRRTVASGLFASGHALPSASLVLGHATASITAQYIVPEAPLSAMVPIYDAWEKQVRKAASLEASVDFPRDVLRMTPQQIATVDALRALAVAQGIDGDTLTAALQGPLNR